MDIEVSVELSLVQYVIMFPLKQLGPFSVSILPSYRCQQSSGVLY